jgi:hypothetical protein
MPLALAQLQDLRDRISDRLRLWSRSAQFWVRAADIYTSYKVTHLLVYMPLKFVFLIANRFGRSRCASCGLGL